MPPPPPTITLGEAEKVGRVALLAAYAGATAGTRMSRPERARIASIVPELIFVKYAFVGVFILFSIKGAPTDYLSQMDKLSTIRHFETKGAGNRP